MRVGQIVILSGPSGTGKDAVIRAWKLINPFVRSITTYTTRAIRPGETDGTDYHFVSREQFQELSATAKLLEWKEVHENLYGSPAEEVDQTVAEGKIAVLKIDVQGAREVRLKRPAAISVFICPPSIEVLAQRLRSRGTDSEEQIQLRLRDARTELEASGEYDYRIVNDNLERTAAELNQIVAKVLECRT